MAQGLVQSFKAGLTQIDTVAFEPLGIIRYTDNTVYKYVRFSGTTSFAPGDFLMYVLTDTLLQTVDAAASAVGAGGAMATVASGTVQYGWIQIMGLYSVTSANVTGSPAAGGYLKPGAAAKQLAAKAAATDLDSAIYVASGTPSIINLICPN